ncbi:MAG: hypothetical protein Ct9H300mP11_29770 [Chloroflexota bacterium]|nr:MAG: hypothetical protein Ct9H300mP11_29770 [Chloroflexota bacterium]
MVNGKRPWRVDLKEAYDRAKERGLLPNDLASKTDLRVRQGTCMGVGGRRFESDHPDQKIKRSVIGRL